MVDSSTSTKAPRKMPRKVAYFPLPNCEMAPFMPAVVQTIALRIVHQLYITQHVVESSVSQTGRLTLCLFHGNAPEQSVETFDTLMGCPKRQRYTPNKKLMLVVDPKKNFFYLVVDKKDLLKVLQSLNGTLFPGRHVDEPFATLKPNFEQLPYLFSDARMPMSDVAAYTSLRLRGFTSYSAGVNPARFKVDWSKDGFESLDFGLIPFVKRIRSVRLEVKPRYYNNSFLMTLYRDAGVISVQLSEKTFDIIPEILKLCTEGLTARQVLPYAMQQEFDFPARNA